LYSLYILLLYLVVNFSVRVSYGVIYCNVLLLFNYMTAAFTNILNAY